MNGFHRSRRKRPDLKDAETFLKQGYGGNMRREDFVSTEERRKRLTALAADLESKLKEHLPRSRNLELVILKCHLLLEFMFNQFIDLIAPREGVIDSDRFTFKQKETLVHMFGFPADPCFFPTIDLLNSVRNAVAHTLALDRQKIDKLIRINCDDPKDARCLSDVQRASALKQITKCMCWKMIGTVEAKHEIEWMRESDKAESGTTTHNGPAEAPTTATRDAGATGMRPRRGLRRRKQVGPAQT